MHNGYKFRLYPSKEQEKIFLRWIGCQHLIYNAKVQEDRYFRKFQRRMVGLAGEKPPVDLQYSHFITEHTTFLREVPSQVLRNGATRWRQAYARFFQGLAGDPPSKSAAESSPYGLRGNCSLLFQKQTPAQERFCATSCRLERQHFR
jgi:putative transposase